MTEVRRNADGTRTGFNSLAAGGLRWDSLPMRLFTGGNAKFWNPADIDFSQDAEDWKNLTEQQRIAAKLLCAQFIAGEEAVTEDIQPFIAAMRAEGRLEDEMYLSQFAFEEAKHVEAFRRWLDAIGVYDDLHEYLDDNQGYRTLFYEELPQALGALHEDPSPASQVRASVTYNHIIEGTLALTGYYAWDTVCKQENILPGMQEVVRSIGRDERRHMAWGTFTCRRHVAADEGNWQLVQDRMNELLEPALEMVRYGFAYLGEDMPFGLDEDEMITYATDRAGRRLNAIESAVGKHVAEIEGDMSPEELEEQFATEDRKAKAAATT